MPVLQVLISEARLLLSFAARYIFYQLLQRVGIYVHAYTQVEKEGKRGEKSKQRYGEKIYIYISMFLKPQTLWMADQEKKKKKVLATTFVLGWINRKVSTDLHIGYIYVMNHIFV